MVLRTPEHFITMFFWMFFGSDTVELFVVISLFVIKCSFIDFGNIIACSCQCVNAAK
jgi:hypothetical protein